MDNGFTTPRIMDNGVSALPTPTPAGTADTAAGGPLSTGVALSLPQSILSIL